MMQRSNSGGNSCKFSDQPLEFTPRLLEELAERIRVLERERDILQASCGELQANHDILLETIGTVNQNQIQAEMLSMELEQVFSSCADATWVVRKDNRVVRANEAMLTLLGKPAKDVVGRLCWECLDGLHCSHNSCPLGGDALPVKETDLTRTTSAGNPQHFIVSAASLVTLDGTPGIVVQFKDITDRKIAEAALEEANSALVRMARLDSLTQLANRRVFDETMKTEWCRLAREQKQLALVLCDIDCFKQYNDTYGHQAGDECLRQVSRILGDCAKRSGDLVCRYGGEEFIFLLPNTCLDGGVQFAERVRQNVETLALAHRNSRAMPVVTLSLGVAACIPRPDMTPDALVKAADEALYQAKELGRNRVVPA